MPRPPDDAVPTPPTTFRNRIGLTIFSLIFLAVGILFTTLILKSLSAAIVQRSWSTADCVITGSAIDDNQKTSQPNYRFEVAFTYTVPTTISPGGQPLTATQLRTDYSGTSDYYDAQTLHDNYAIGTHATCYFDSAHPQTAVLQRTSLLIGAGEIIPLIFVAIGIAGIVFTWSSSPQTPPASKPKRGALAGRVVFGLFFIVGVAVLLFLFVPMIARGWNARSWPQIPCTIVHSGVSSHSSNKGRTTYGIEVLYRYQFNGINYGSSRYSIMSSSSSDYYGNEDVVHSLPPKKKTICFVNPHDPAYAVLDRSFRSILFFGLIPLLFTIVGVAGLFGKLGSKTSDAQTPPVDMPGSMMGTVPIPKKPQNPANLLLAAFVFAAFWNGIVSIFVNQFIVDWQHGDHDYFSATFLLPFVFVGILLIVHVGFRVVKCFRPTDG